MNRRPITIDSALFPDAFRELVADAAVYDSSCSPEARVYFLEKDGGLYLKSAPKGSLKTEASMTSFYHSKGLSAEVLAYAQLEQDWLLTRAIPGEDCLDKRYLEDPKKLSETMGMLLRSLHETDRSGCPIADRTSTYLDSVTQNYQKGHFDRSLFPGNQFFQTSGEAWQVVQQFAGELKQDTLLHGDYCLPNILLHNWSLSGYIDVGNGGIGDRHIDLFWGTWTLIFNLKTDAWCHRFLDAYGRDRIEPEILRSISAFESFL